MFDNLNAAQLEAVTATEGYIRVIAGAGSGKTRALSYRFAFLVNEAGIPAANILCVTFTNKSAAEMRQRIHNLVGDDDHGYINTFHGFCSGILKEDGYALSYPKNFMVLDNADIDAMLKGIYEERSLTMHDMTFSAARAMIEEQKLFRKPEYYLDMLTMSQEALFTKYQEASSTDDIIFYGYLCQEKKSFALDYNDLIKFTLYLFKINEEIRLKWQTRLEYIMIDEFQDIDSLQYELMETLCAYHKNLFVVGDPDQTIYTWRGANVRYLLNFDKQFPGTRTISLLTNYRSTPQIVKAANSLIEKNTIRYKKELRAAAPDGKSVLVFHGKTEEEEAVWIASEIKVLAAQGVPLGDIALLYRAHSVTRPFEKILLREELPYTIYSGVPFYARMEVKDALSYLRMVIFQDDLSFLRIVNLPKRNIGEKRIRFLKTYAMEQGLSLYASLVRTQDEGLFKGTGAADFIRLIEGFKNGYENRLVSELLSDLLDKSGYEQMRRTEGSQERLDNLAQLKQAVYEYEISCGEEASPEDYLNHVSLLTGIDAGDAPDRLRLMTIHSAKGLEFPYVFLCSLNEGVFPSRRVRTRERMEEERRLAFVAMTRAKKRLYLSQSQGRNLDGSVRYPSRFLLDIDPSLLEYARAPQEDLIRAAKDYIRLNTHALSLSGEKAGLHKGDRIRHPIFGEGTILDTNEEAGTTEVLFDKMKTSRQLSARARLEKI